MNRIDLTPSEVIVLCGEHFADQIRSADSSTARTLHGALDVDVLTPKVSGVKPDRTLSRACANRGLQTQ
jgi:hypothetical protein